MKAEQYRLTESKVIAKLLRRLEEIPLDGKIMVTIGNVGTKTQRQRNLQWVWYKDVVKSGIGGKHEEDADAVDLFAKWKWCLPILLYDPGMDQEWQTDFQDLFLDYSARYKHNPRKMKYFIRNHVHTEKLPVNLMAKFLSEFERYYIDKGAQLSDPSTYGYDRNLLDHREAA